MKKIIVIGVTGSGKSTLARVLANQLDYKYIQLYQLFWKANWEESLDDEFFFKIRKEIAGDSWVIDGNYTRSNWRLGSKRTLSFGSICPFTRLYTRALHVQ